MLIAEVDEEPVLYPDSGSNRNYFGQIVDLNGVKQCAFLKVLDDRQLANEIIAYLAAKSLSLPIPSACLAFCPTEFLPGCESWGLGIAASFKPGFILVFASRQHGHSVTKHIGSPMEGSLPGELFLNLWENFLTELSRMLVAWPEVARLACFDRWMANTDRNHGNLVIDSDGTIAIIDHERVLFDIGFDELDAVASTDCPSQILLMINPEDRGRVLMAGAAKAMSEAVLQRKSLEVAEFVALNVSGLFSHDDGMRIAAFLSYRRECLAASAWRPQKA